MLQRAFLHCQKIEIAKVDIALCNFSRVFWIYFCGKILNCLKYCLQWQHYYKMKGKLNAKRVAPISWMIWDLKSSIHGDLQGQKWIKNAKNVNLWPKIRTIQSSALTLFIDIFNGYLWSLMIETDITASSGQKIDQEMSKMSILVLESELSNLVPYHFAKTPSMAIYGYIRLELMTSVLICLEVYGDLLFRNWSKIFQECQFRPPGSRISNLVPHYCTRRFLLLMFIWLKLICHVMVCG